MTAPTNIAPPPNSAEAEQGVIGGLLLDGHSAMERIEGVVSEKHFYCAENREIFASIAKMARENKPIDTITVAEALETSGRLGNVGGIEYLGSLAVNVPSTANIRRYAEIVRDRALQRSLLTLSRSIGMECAAPGANVAEIISRADAAMAQLLSCGRTEDGAVSLTNCMSAAIADIDERASGHRRSGLQTGISGFDALTCGLEPGQLVIIAARTSVGKTAFALNIADNVSKQGETVVFLSLEMGNRELTHRLISMATGVSVSEMRSGRLSESDWGKVSECLCKSDQQRMFLIDRPAIGVDYVRTEARRIQRQHGLGLIVVDYLGLMRGEGQNRTVEIGSLTRGLKALAMELNVPIIALSQLNRALESRTDKRPVLSDLRESGDVEQDANIVVMLHREELYDPSPKWHGLAEILVRKNRSGPIGDFAVTFEAKSMRFSDCLATTPRPSKSKVARQHGGHNASLAT